MRDGARRSLDWHEPRGKSQAFPEEAQIDSGQIGSEVRDEAVSQRSSWAVLPRMLTSTDVIRDTERGERAVGTRSRVAVWPRLAIQPPNHGIIILIAPILARRIGDTITIATSSNLVKS